MLLKVNFCITYFLFFAISIHGQNTCDYNSDVKACYTLISQLKIKEANNNIINLKKNQPRNLAIIHLENYLDFFVLFITENQTEYNNRIGNKNTRLAKLDDVGLKDPYVNFIKAEILLQWSLIHLKFDEKVKAGADIYAAYNLLEENKKDYPNFIDNNKSLSIIHALAESVPKWVRKIVGIKGSISLGKEEIEKIAKYAIVNTDYIFRDEVASIYSYILFYQLNQKDKAIAELEKFNLDHKTSPLIAFLKSSMYLRLGNNDKCLKILNELDQDDSRLPFHYLEFMKGRSLLYKQDAQAEKFLSLFVNNFKGRHFMKEAYQKLAWYHLSINGDAAAYKKYMGLCKVKGFAEVDEDKQALKEAETNILPNPFLLKSRILFDGGYYSKAQAVLIKNEKNLSSNAKTNVEFDYRMARILQALRNYQDAIQYFKNTIKNGGHQNYFAASAALQLGFIYEDLKQTKSAGYYYNLCTQMDPPEYKNSIHQKAKSGLLRVK